MIDQNQMFDFAINAFKWLGVYTGSYAGILLSLNVLPSVFSKKIRSQQELEKIVSEEAKKLDIQRVKAYFNNQKRESFSQRGRDGVPEVHLGGFNANRSMVKHELYHIYKEHIDIYFNSTLLQDLVYFFILEPQALMYQAFNIKI